MSKKAFVSNADPNVAAANTPDFSSDGSLSPEKVARPRAKSTTKAKTKTQVKPEKPVKVSRSKAKAEAPESPEYGTFRCLVCDYSQVILPGMQKPASGWRCPYDYSNLVWVRQDLPGFID